MAAEPARSRIDRQRATTPERLGWRRLPASERAAWLIEEASRLFAEQGWSASTRTLARRLGVTQALLYKYFPSKQASFRNPNRPLSPNSEEKWMTELQTAD